jgi:hypothetical protein
VLVGGAEFVVCVPVLVVVEVVVVVVVVVITCVLMNVTTQEVSVVRGVIQLPSHSFPEVGTILMQ